MKKILILIVISLLCLQPLYSKTTTLDDFENINDWKTVGDSIQIFTGEGTKGSSIGIEYELSEDKKYVVILKPTSITLPDNYVISFYVKGNGEKNNLELKLIDGNGNTFIKVWENFNFSNKWQKVKVIKSDIKFGWGKDSKANLKKITQIEFAITHGKTGKGKAYIDELSIKKLKPTEIKKTDILKNLKITSSSIQNESSPINFIADGNMGTRWSSQFNDKEWVIFDFGKTDKFVGIILHWEAAYGKDYEILISKNKKSWKKVYSITDENGGEDNIDFKKNSARYIKINLTKRGTGWGYSLWEVLFKTEKEPFGIGIAEPDILVKKRWNFLKSATKEFYAPKSWKGQKSQLIISGTKNKFSLYLNNKLIKKISPEMKKPVTFDIYKYLKTGKLNVLKIKASKKVKKIGSINSLIFTKNKDALNDKLSELKNTSADRYYYFLADLYSEGHFPLWLNSKQAYWTMIGSEDSYEESLLSDTGIISAYTKGFSVIPYLYINDRLVTFNDVKIKLSLKANYLPIPTVKWTWKKLEFSQTLFGYDKNKKSATYMIYTLKNRSNKKVKGKLYISLRPFEVNPPWQHGGLTKIKNIKGIENNKIIKINNDKGIISITEPDEFGVSTFSRGDIIMDLNEGKIPSRNSASDPSGHLSGALSYEFEIGPKQEKEYLFIIPLDISINKFKIPEKEEFPKALAKSIKRWKKLLNRVKIDIPEKRLFDVLRSNLAYMLISKDGYALQPGSRSYEHSWIRDGSVMSAALLRLAHTKISKDYVNWISTTQFDSGEIPCIVNAKTGKLVGFAQNWKEWDGQGAYVFSVADYYNFTKDKNFAKKLYPVVEKALKFLQNLRESMKKNKYKNTASYGILPKSESHEGYIGNPQQSLWDDFYGLKGWKDGQIIAKAAGREDKIEWMKKEENSFRKDLHASIKIVQKKHNIKYIPASIGLADFDPTSTASSVFPAFEHKYLDQKSLLYTFDKYYKGTFLPRSKNLDASYTPYEIRTANAYAIMGIKDRALKMIRYFLKDLRPAEWNHWAEVVHADYYTPAYIGDMPHTWIGAIFINTVRNMLLFENDDTLIIGSCIDEKWLKKGISIENMPSYYGIINYTMKSKGNNVILKISGKNIKNPKNGYLIRNPKSKPIKKVTINNKKWIKFTKNEITFNTLPADITIGY